MQNNQFNYSEDEIIRFTLRNTEMFYIKDTNQFFKKWKKDNKFREQPFTEDTGGYLRCNIHNKKFLKHRLIYYVNNLNWDISNSDSKTNSIDHIDGDRKNNNITNLRVVTQQQNCWNRTKAKGYCWHKRVNKWCAEIKVNGKKIHLGYFDTEHDARQAYLNVKHIYHPLP